MVYIKPKPEYIDTSTPFHPGPKNGHYSTRDPAWAALEPTVEETMRSMYGPEISMADFKASWLASPLALPDGCPEPGKDVEISQMKATVRDGTEIGLQIYRNSKTKTVGRGDATLVYRIHSGGWTVCGHEVEEGENRSIGALEGVVVASVDYRLAPEFKYPIPGNDCWDVLKWCKANSDKLGIDPEKIIIAGNSGGGSLAITLALQARDEGLTGIRALSLGFPGTCHPKFFDQVPGKEKYELLSYRQNEHAGLVNALRMEFFWDIYLDERDRQPDWHHSPLLAEDLSRLPPMRIICAGADPLRDEGIAFAERCRDAGNDVLLKVYGGLPHCFYFFPTVFQQVPEYYSELLDFVRKHST